MVIDYRLNNNYEDMLENIIEVTRKYFAHDVQLESMIIGISGGIDSALTAALARAVCNLLGLDGREVTLIGQILDMESDKKEMHRAERVANTFCKEYKYINYDGLYHQAANRIISKGVSNKDMVTQIRKGNIKARLRMIKLFDEANRRNGLVLSTDNLTEYSLGFWTLHGDVGNFGMIQNLWKTEVYGLAEHLIDYYERAGRIEEAGVLKDCVDAMPTDGLGITPNDFDQLFPTYDKKKKPCEIYKEIDDILIAHLTNDKRVNTNNNVVTHHKLTEFKRNDPISIDRRDLLLHE